MDYLDAIAEITRGLAAGHQVVHHCGSQSASDNLTDYFLSTDLPHENLTSTWRGDFGRWHEVTIIPAPVEPVYAAPRPTVGELVRSGLDDLRQMTYLFGCALTGRSC